MVHFSIFPVAISLNCIPTIICYCCIFDAGEIKEENENKKINQIISKMKQNKNYEKYKKSSKKQQDQQHFNIYVAIFWNYKYIF